MPKELIAKYNIQAPRYTSYPTVPYWDNTPTDKVWTEHVKNVFRETNSEKGISLYIHIPFCESLCTFCGCNTRISVNHAVEQPYIEALLKEWDLYCLLMDEKPNLKELHIGGGTPNFLSEKSFNRLITGICEKSELNKNFLFGVEVNPANVSLNQIETLNKLGFTRLSMGIQDFNPVVQKAINRVQSFETVEKITKFARKNGFTSINYDLVYGLPFQQIDSFNNAIDLVNKLHPDRIALYSYAHVPWVKPSQRSYNEDDLPDADLKSSLYEHARDRLLENGYFEIGMDHFALESDELYSSFYNQTLHRNFMGYTTCSTKLQIGIGVSSISDSWSCFIQNKKTLDEYLFHINKNQLPILKGHILTNEDLIIRRHILNLMCKYETYWEKGWDISDFEEYFREFEKDKLIELLENGVRITEKGKPFLRNICMVLDVRLGKSKPEKQIFSKAI